MGNCKDLSFRQEKLSMSHSTALVGGKANQVTTVAGGNEEAQLHSGEQKVRVKVETVKPFYPGTTSWKHEIPAWLSPGPLFPSRPGVLVVSQIPSYLTLDL